MDTRRAENFLRRGRELERRGRFEKAIELYRRAEAADPNNLQAHDALAAALAKVPPQEVPPAEPPKESAAKPLELLDRLRRLDAVDSHNGDAFYSMGMELKEGGKDKEAAVLLQRFVALEKAAPSPRQELLKKAQDALFEMNAPLLPEPATPGAALLDSQ